MKIGGKTIKAGVRSLLCTRANCPPARAIPCWLRRLVGKSPKPGVDIVGFLRSEIGLGEAARLMVAALDAGDIPAGLVNVPLPGRMAEPALANRLAASSRHRTALAIFGAAEIGMFARRACRDQTNIAYPYWELPRFPAAWRHWFERFDVYWAPTTFIRDALESVRSRPIHLVPQPVDLPAEPRHQPFTGPLKFHTFFDADSSIARKNPLGTIEAFRLAFPSGREDARLLVKARGGGSDAARLSSLLALARQDARIEIIDGTLTRAEMTALMEDCNVFVSLHRSEGFGLGCAEALARGKAVIATDFGGTRDFINEQTGYPVQFAEAAVPPEDYFGTEGSYWAEPSIAHAASIMRAIYDDPGQTTAKAQAGFAHLKRHNSFDAVGHLIKARLG